MFTISGLDPSTDEPHPAIPAWFLRNIRDDAPHPVDTPTRPFLLIHGSMPHFCGHLLGQLGLQLNTVHVITGSSTTRDALDLTLAGLSDPGKLNLSSSVIQLMADDLNQGIATHVRSLIIDWRLRSAAREAELAAQEARTAKRVAKQQAKDKEQFKAEKRKERAMKRLGKQAAPQEVPEHATQEAPDTSGPTPPQPPAGPTELVEAPSQSPSSMFPLAQKQRPTPTPPSPTLVPPDADKSPQATTATTTQGAEDVSSDSEGPVLPAGARRPLKGQQVHPSKPGAKAAAEKFKRPRSTSSKDLDEALGKRKR